MVDAIVILILLAIVGGIVAFLVRAKQQGQACIGCPHSKQCGAKKGGCTCGDKK